MGVASDQPGVPFKPQAPLPGMPSSGIMGQGQNIRGMANKAKENVSARQQRFTQMLATTNAATQPQQPAQPAQPAAAQVTPEQYIKAGQLLVDHRDQIDRFVHWVLFG